MNAVVDGVDKLALDSPVAGEDLVADRLGLDSPAPEADHKAAAAVEADGPAEHSRLEEVGTAGSALEEVRRSPVADMESVMEDTGPVLDYNLVVEMLYTASDSAAKVLDLPRIQLLLTVLVRRIARLSLLIVRHRWRYGCSYRVFAGEETFLWNCSYDEDVVDDVAEKLLLLVESPRVRGGLNVNGGLVGRGVREGVGGLCTQPHSLTSPALSSR